MLIELRWHSRGGLGALTSARVLAEAVWEFGYWAQAFPEYGPERAGAPMMCYDRLSTQKISLHCGIYEPAIVAVLDPALLATIPVTEGLKPSGILVVNTDTPAPQVVQCLGLQIQATRSRGHRIITLDATAIAQTCQCFKENRPMPNSPILGALLELLARVHYLRFFTVRGLRRGGAAIFTCRLPMFTWPMCSSTFARLRSRKALRLRKNIRLSRSS